MREVGITVRARDVEAALDRLLPILPGGVRELSRRRSVELVARGDDLPSAAELRAALGRLRAELSERTASDDWRERRLADHRPLLVGGRVLIREDWAPGAAAIGLGPDAIEIVLGAGSAFGTGSHPTTRTCVELLLGAAPGGAFVDLGCGTGVLAILAARLGWTPVTAIDLAGEAAVSAAANAFANGVDVAVHQADITVDGAVPPAHGIAANVPASVHVALAGVLAPGSARMLIVSGFGEQEADGVLSAYGRRGLKVEQRRDADGWTIARLGSATD